MTPLVARPGRRDRRHVAADLRVPELPRPHRGWSRHVAADNDRRRLPGGVGRRDRPGAQHHGAVGTRAENGAGSPARGRHSLGVPHSGPCPAGSCARRGGHRPARRQARPCPAQGRGPGAVVIAGARGAGGEVRTAARASRGPVGRRRRGEWGRRPRAGAAVEGSGGTTGAPAGAPARPPPPRPGLGRPAADASAGGAARAPGEQGADPAGVGRPQRSSSLSDSARRAGPGRSRA
jgi:hypothetical protein